MIPPERVWLRHVSSMHESSGKNSGLRVVGLIAASNDQEHPLLQERWSFIARRLERLRPGESDLQRPVATSSVEI